MDKSSQNIDASFFSCSSSIAFPYLQKAGNDRGNLLTHQEDNYYLQRPSQPPATPMRLCHRFGLKRFAKLLMLRDERHRSFFLFLAVLRAVVQGYVKNKLKRHIVAKIAVCYRVKLTQSLRHNCRHAVSQNLMTVVASI